MPDSKWTTPFFKELSIPGGTCGSVDDSGTDVAGNQDEGTAS